MESRDTTIIICAGAPNPALHRIPEMTGDDELVIIGVDSGCLALIDAGYTIDISVGDFDSVTASQRDYIEEVSREFHLHPTSKDETDMELAIDVILQRYSHAARVLIFGGMGESVGRIDHLLANLWMVHNPNFAPLIDKLYFIEAHHQFNFLQPGVHEIHSLESTRYLSVISLTPVEDLTIENAVYELAQTSFDYPVALISNEFIDINEFVTVGFRAGLIVVIQVDNL